MPEMNVSIRLLETREYSDIRTMNDNDHFRFQGQHFCKGKRKINAINAGVQNVYSCVLIGVFTIISPNA